MIISLVSISTNSAHVNQSNEFRTDKIQISRDSRSEDGLGGMGDEARMGSWGFGLADLIVAHPRVHGSVPPGLAPR